MTILGKILKFKLISFSFFASFLFVCGAFVWVYVAVKDVGGPIVVRFNNASGISQLGSFFDAAIVALTGAIFAIINFFLALELRERDQFLAGIIAIFTLLLSILIFIGFAAIIAVN